MPTVLRDPITFNEQFEYPLLLAGLASTITIATSKINVYVLMRAFSSCIASMYVNTSHTHTHFCCIAFFLFRLVGIF